MLEGHRHEKVVLIITSYVIGFTTAFIAFGINQLLETEDVVSAPVAFKVVKAVAQAGPEKILSVSSS